jgi:hypothetical protein
MVLRLAKENRLKSHGIPTAPERKKTTTWSEFIHLHILQKDALAMTGSPHLWSCPY